jgi:hypothetical protein
VVRLETVHALVFDRYRDNRQTGSFILIDRIHNFTVAAGMLERAVLASPASCDETSNKFYAAPITPAERFERYGHRPAVVVSRSETLRKAVERALFARGAAVVALEALPSNPQLRGLLANGLILLAPPAPWKLKGVDYIEAAEAESVRESVPTTLRELERRGVLVSRLRAGTEVCGGD